MVTVKITEPVSTNAATHLRAGEYGIITDSVPAIVGEVVRRTLKGLISLSSSKEWNEEVLWQIMVKPLAAGTAITLTLLPQVTESVAREAKRIRDTVRVPSNQHPFGTTGGKIDAIKYVRSVANLGLREAKELVESL